MDYEKDQDFKKQRQNLIQSIRRQNRQAQFNKRRHHTSQNNSFQYQVDVEHSQQNNKKTSKILVVDEERREVLQIFIKEKYFPHMFADLVKLLFSQNIIEKHHGIIGIRKILSLNDTPPINLVFQHNILPFIIECMKQNIYPHLKLEATWIITNIATGGPTDITSLMEFNVIPILTQFLFENKPGIVDQAIWAIGNLAGDSSTLRDKVIEQKGVDSVINFINNTSNKSNLINGAWALSNLCRGNPLPCSEKIQKAVPILCKLVSLNILEDQNLSDVLWAISYSIQSKKKRISQFLESKALQKVIQSAQNPMLSVASPALRIIGTISTGNQVQTQSLLNNNILQIFEELLQSKKSLVRRQVCWILSNIAAGTKSQVNELLSHQELIDKVLQLFQLDSHQVKRQICYIFANMVFLGQQEKIKDLYIRKQVLRYYGQCIKQRNNYKLIQTCLDTLPMLFDFGQKMKGRSEGINFVIYNFLNYPGISQNFQKLHEIQSQKIYEKALKVYERYFEPQDGDSKLNNMQVQI